MLILKTYSQGLYIGRGGGNISQCHFNEKKRKRERKKAGKKRENVKEKGRKKKKKRKWEVK
jgi:hypothetical protein